MPPLSIFRLQVTYAVRTYGAHNHLFFKLACTCVVVNFEEWHWPANFGTLHHKTVALLLGHGLLEEARIQSRNVGQFLGGLDFLLILLGCWSLLRGQQNNHGCVRTVRQNKAPTGARAIEALGYAWEQSSYWGIRVSYVYELVRLRYAANSISLVCVCDLRMMSVSSVRPFGTCLRNAF